jgi:hypothetical protein
MFCPDRVTIPLNVRHEIPKFRIGGSCLMFVVSIKIGRNLRRTPDRERSTRESSYKQDLWIEVGVYALL